MSELPNGWSKGNLVGCLENLIDYRGKTPKKADNGIVTLSAKSVKMGKIDYSQAYYISKKTYESFMVRGFPEKGDILMTTEAPLGCIAKLDRDDVSVAQRLLTLRGKAGVLDNNYLMYYLTSRIGQYELHARASGSTVQGIKRSEFNFVDIILPSSFDEQKAIAAVLSAFDDKIELLRKQNQTLETLAQTIFKEWFVNFNFPDKDGKPYKDNGDEMVDSELGEIPNGWRVGNIGNVLELLYGKPLKTEDRTGSGFPVYGSNGVVGYHEKYLVAGPGIIVGRKGSMGEVVWSNNSFHPIDTTFYVSTLLEMKGLFYHYFLLKRYDFEKIGSDSAVPGLNRNAVYVIELVVPSLGVIEKFNTICESIFKKIKNNTSQIKTLTKTRDTLLPKLMIGETRVKGFEQ